MKQAAKSLSVTESSMQRRVVILRDDRRRRHAINLIHSIRIDPDHLWEVVIQEHSDKRSLAQNRLMWFWFTVIMKHIQETQGKYFSKKQIHDFFCHMFLPVISEEIMGKIIACQQTTSDLKVKEFIDFLNNIEHYCFDNKTLQLILPRREDLYYDAMSV